METITCPRCRKINPSDALNCEQCKINLQYATQNPDEIERIKKEELERRQQETLADLSRGGWKCPRCGFRHTKTPILNSHCAQCNEPTVPSRLTEPLQYPKLEEPLELDCYAPQKETLILAKPDMDAETLYVIGYGDVLPILGEEGDFYQLLLPVEEKGFALKAAGMKVPVGLGEVADPLGYVRPMDSPYFNAPVMVRQPGGRLETIYTLKKEDRFPVVAEQPHAFMIQLPNGLRGWVNKGRVIRTMSPESLPQQGSTSLATVLGTVALLGLAVVGGALTVTEGSEETKVRKAVDRELQRRGL